LATDENISDYTSINILRTILKIENYKLKIEN